MMEHPDKCFLLGLDIGSSQSKGVLTDVRGRILARAAVDHVTREVQPGFYEHDPERIWIHDCKELIAALKSEARIGAEQIAAVCVSAIGPCVLPVAESGKPLGSAILYGIDTRACEEIRELNEQYGEETFLRRCGNSLSTQAAGPKIAWIRKHRREIFDRARWFMTSTTYVVFRLTGEVFIDHYTACAGYTPLYDYTHMCWDVQMCEAVGCRGRLPELRWTAEAPAAVTASAAAEFGLAEGVRVCVGTCDAAAEAVSAGVVDEGQTMLMMGSTAFLISVLDKPAVDRRLWAAPYLFPGTCCLLGGMGSAGSLTGWFLRELSKQTLAEAEAAHVSPYALLEEKAARVAPGCDKLLALPYFCGERTPLNDPKARGVFFGLTLSHTEGHLYRALLEAVAFGIRDNLEAMAESGCKVRTCRTVGGGAQNALWTQIISDVTGCRQIINEVTLGASYGDAFLAGLGCGLIEDRQAIRTWTRRKAEIVPDEDRQCAYDRLFPIFKELYHTLRGLMQDF